jgi:hypothetical protein
MRGEGGVHLGSIHENRQLSMVLDVELEVLCN